MAATDYPLNQGVPPGFNRKYNLNLQIKYTRDIHGCYSFYYLVVQAPDYPKAKKQLVNNTWVPLISTCFGSINLDFGIQAGDHVITIDTLHDIEGTKLYWSRSNPAITTKHKHDDLYGDLLYWDGAAYQNAPPANQPCDRIQFLAKLGPRPVQRHKFNCYVIVQDENGNPQEMKIDPDIKNPSV